MVVVDVAIVSLATLNIITLNLFLHQIYLYPPRPVIHVFNLNIDPAPGLNLNCHHRSGHRKFYPLLTFTDGFVFLNGASSRYGYRYG